MQIWWNESPYYDTVVYLPAPNKQFDANLNAAWVAQVQAQGWAFFPTWLGLQAPCANQTGLSEFSDTNGASTGKSEADSAASAASALGLAGTIIYKDMENYNTGDSACAAAVTAYVGAWVAELHNLGYKAGVYANPAPAQQNISKASPLPDDVWIAKYDSRATTWALNPLSDNYWASNQRMHQYLNYPASGVGESYGGVAFECPGACIDRDIDDAFVAGSSGAKTYSSWTFYFIDHPNTTGPDTQLGGTNDKYMGLPSGPYVPFVTGGYCDAGSNCTDFIDNDIGFWYDNGTFNPLNSTLGGMPQPYGLNNQGVVTGDLYTSAAGQPSGWEYDTVRSVATTINVPWTNNGTKPYRINDAAEVSGTWIDTNDVSHGFLLDSKSTWNTVDYPHAQSTVFQGINGLGEIAGYYIDNKRIAHGFVYSQTDGFVLTGSCASGDTIPTSINNNGQVAGYCGSSSEGSFLYDLPHNTFTIIAPASQSGSVQAFGVSDQPIVVGRCSTAPCDSAVGAENGFYLVPSH